MFSEAPLGLRCCSSRLFSVFLFFSWTGASSSLATLHVKSEPHSSGRSLPTSCSHLCVFPSFLRFYFGLSDSHPFFPHTSLLWHFLFLQEASQKGTTVSVLALAGPLSPLPEIRVPANLLLKLEPVFFSRRFRPRRVPHQCSPSKLLQRRGSLPDVEVETHGASA